MLIERLRGAIDATHDPWSEVSCAHVGNRYDTLAKLPILGALCWLPRRYRTRAAQIACPVEGLTVTEIGSNIGQNIPYLSIRAGPDGLIDAIEISKVAHRKSVQRHSALGNVHFV